MVSDSRCAAPGGSTGLSEPSSGCRIKEFAQYHPVALVHERTHLSNALGNPFLGKDLREGIEHDLIDINYLLAELEKRDAQGMEHG